MGEEDGLGALEVGVAGNGRGDLALGEVEQGALEGAELADAPGGFGARVEAEVGGDLVVAGSPRVELGADVGGALRDEALDEGVDILVLSFGDEPD